MSVTSEAVCEKNNTCWKISARKTPVLDRRFLVAPPRQRTLATLVLFCLLEKKILCAFFSSLRCTELAAPQYPVLRIKQFTIKKPGIKPDFLMVAPPRLELGTQGSSGLCSTN